jgi:DNA repair protein RecO (recombination protein O)
MRVSDGLPSPSCGQKPSTALEGALEGRRTSFNGVRYVSAEKTEAIIIRQTDYSETSRILRLFTREFGTISAIAKGGRRLKGPFEAALDLLARCRIVFLRKSSGGLDILTEAQLISRFTPNRRHLTALYAGYYVAELLNHLTEEYDPCPELYDAAVRTLQRLESDAPPDVTILRFELILLQQFGHLPAFDECVTCRSPITPQSSPLSFWVSQGGLLCAKCQRKEFAKTPIHPGTIAVLRRLAQADDPLADRVAVSPEQQRELRTMVTAVISHLLGRRPKMARYLQL